MRALLAGPPAPPDHPKTKTRPPIEKVSIFHQNVDLALTLAMWERQRESLCENENSMSSFNQKNCFFTKNIDFSLEKCRFGAHRGVLHYVLRRQRAILGKNGNFKLENSMLSLIHI